MSNCYISIVLLHETFDKLASAARIMRASPVNPKMLGATIVPMYRKEVLKQQKKEVQKCTEKWSLGRPCGGLVPQMTQNHTTESFAIHPLSNLTERLRDACKVLSPEVTTGTAVDRAGGSLGPVSHLLSGRVAFGEDSVVEGGQPDMAKNFGHPGPNTPRQWTEICFGHGLESNWDEDPGDAIIDASRGKADGCMCPAAAVGVGGYMRGRKRFIPSPKSQM